MDGFSPFFRYEFERAPQGKMAFFLRRLTLTLRGFLLSVILISCSDSGMGPKKGLAPLVGVWEAVVLTVPDPEDPSQIIDLIDEGAAYALSVLSTGHYTAVFNFLGFQGFEAGEIQLTGDEIKFTPTSPPGTVMAGLWMFQGDRLIVDALREIDFNGDGNDEVVPIHLELTPRQP